MHIYILGRDTLDVVVFHKAHLALLAERPVVRQRNVPSMSWVGHGQSSRRIHIAEQHLRNSSSARRTEEVRMQDRVNLGVGPTQVVQSDRQKKEVRHKVPVEEEPCWREV